MTSPYRDVYWEAFCPVCHEPAEVRPVHTGSGSASVEVVCLNCQRVYLAYLVPVEDTPQKENLK
jgi:hypothetical protein